MAQAHNIAILPVEILEKIINEVLRNNQPNAIIDVGHKALPPITRISSSLRAIAIWRVLVETTFMIRGDKEAKVLRDWLKDIDKACLTILNGKPAEEYIRSISFPNFSDYVSAAVNTDIQLAKTLPNLTSLAISTNTVVGSGAYNTVVEELVAGHKMKHIFQLRNLKTLYVTFSFLALCQLPDDIRNMQDWLKEKLVGVKIKVYYGLKAEARFREVTGEYETKVPHEGEKDRKNWLKAPKCTYPEIPCAGHFK